MIARLILIGTAVLGGMQVAADEDAASRWAELKRAGAAEGRVVVAGPAFPGLRDALARAFEEDTGISLEWRPLTGGPGPFTAQLVRELEAGAVQTDVYIGGSTICYSMNRERPGTVDLRKVLVDPSVTDPSVWRHGELSILYGSPSHDDDFWCALNTAEWVMGDLFVNSRYVDPDSIRSWHDLLDPEYRGRIAAHDPRHPGAGRYTAAYLYELFGEEFVRRLYVGQEVANYRSYGELPTDVARGRYWIGIAMVQAGVEPLAKRGLPLVRVFPEDGPGLLTGGFGGIMKLRGGPNPNAGAVFINWWASRRGQEVAQCELMELSLRNDVGRADCVPEWARPVEGRDYPIHSYSPEHYFGAFRDYMDRLSAIFEN